MMIYANITNFTTWFLTQFYNIVRTAINYIDNIQIYNSVTLLDFIITIIIIGILLEIIITIPSKAKLGKEKRKVKNDK